MSPPQSHTHVLLSLTMTYLWKLLLLLASLKPLPSTLVPAPFPILKHAAQGFLETLHAGEEWSSRRHWDSGSALEENVNKTWATQWLWLLSLLPGRQNLTYNCLCLSPLSPSLSIRKLCVKRGTRALIYILIPKLVPLINDDIESLHFADLKMDIRNHMGQATKTEGLGGQGTCLELHI